MIFKQVVKEIEDHKGTKITALTWDDDSARLFIGDERGIVTAVIIVPFKLVSLVNHCSWFTIAYRQMLEGV